MAGQHKLDIEVDTMARLDRLLDQGEKFYSVQSHPGHTREVEDWRDEITGMTSSIWGSYSHYYQKVKETLLFPRWFDPKIHGPFQEGETARVLTPAQEKETQDAVYVYKDGIRKILAQLKSMRSDIDTVGMPSKHDGDANNQSVGITNNYSPHYNPSITNNPQFNQSQNQLVNVWVQQLEDKIVKELSSGTLEPHEKTFLEKVKGGLSTAKSLAEAMVLAVETGAAVGLSASRIAQLLGVN